MTLNQPLMTLTRTFSAHAIALLDREPEILQYLIEVQDKGSFPKEYQPRRIDYLFDDILFASFVNGVNRLNSDCPSGYQPQFMEIRFDGELALFTIQGEVILDRVQQMANLSEILGQVPQ